MKIIYKTGTLALVCFIAMIGILSSCKKDKATSSSGKVELLSFGPTGALHGDTLSFIGNNLDKVTEIDLAGATIASSAFIEHTTELIKVIIPESTQEGLVTLKTTEGNVTSKTVLNLKVPVVIDSIPNEARPGENITITGSYLNWVTEVVFAKDVSVKTFVSQSINQLVIKVPMEAQTGTVVFLTGGTKPLTIETTKEVEIPLPSISSFSPNPVEREAELTITGTNLDLAKGILFKGLTEPDTNFISKSATQIVIKVPKEANKGKISVVAYSMIAVESADELKLAGDLPPLDALGLAFYDDALENGWQKWGGWGGGSSDLDNSDNVRDGNKSAKVTFAGDWGGPLQMGGGNSSTTGYTYVVFSIYGTAGTGGKQLNVLVAGKEKIIDIVEGEWTEYKVPLTDYSSPATINEFTLQDRGFSGTIYIDHIGLK
ncbi:MAG: IPT/TIG domain-containing protein [Agriterribacter sp.]